MMARSTEEDIFTMEGEISLFMFHKLSVYRLMISCSFF